jgi:flagellar biosynthesis protein FlhF
MNLRTFKAPTMAEALVQLKAEMGPDAIILHTRSFQTRTMFGLRRREMVEITAGKGLKRNVPSRSPTPNPGPADRLGAAYNRAGAPTRAITVASTDVQDPRGGPSSEPGRGLLETPVATQAVFRGISQEMASLKTMVKDLVAEARQQKCPQVPEDLFNYYMQLIENQVAEEIASDMIRTLQRQVRPEHFSQPEFMRERLAEQLEKMIPVAGPIVRTKAVGPHVVALVGPTGVGKTTTIAKLAAHLKLRERRRVGLVTLDTFRIAAVDQLKKYADIIGTPLRVVSSADDVRDTLREMSECEFVLIDTAGRSPNDTMKLGELKNVLLAAEPDEVHLVLSSCADEQSIHLAAARFGDMRVDRVIFTKLDEAAHVGVLLNVVRKINKSLSYVTTGQDVPDDIEVGKSRRLAQLILGDAV